jgi:dUTP pyrophosphatase
MLIERICIFLLARCANLNIPDKYIVKKAKFYKVSYEQFASSLSDQILDIQNLYNNLKLPKRATKNSAGYDFFSPIDFTLKPGETIKIPTGIRCEMNPEWVLMIFPRSGLGFKYRLQLNNTVGIIDSDYFYSDNEGHIFLKITNDSNENKILTISAGEGIAQGIFIQYGLTEDDDTTEIRNGGFGSTTKK